MRGLVHVVVFAGVLLGGCVSASHVPKPLGSEIPDKAHAIKLFSSVTRGDLYRDIYRSLAADGLLDEIREAIHSV